MHRNRPKTLVAFALTLMVLATFTAAEAGTWQVDPAHSNIGFKIRHFFTKVPGEFNTFEGTIHYDPDKPAASKVEFTVQADSIDTDNADRDQHLRSADFFDVEDFPTLSFTSKKVEPVGDGELQVTGDLTIHGVTKEVTIPVDALGSMATPMGTRAGFATEFTIDRQEYGVSWNRALDQGGAILGDEVEIAIDVEAVLQEPEEEMEGR